MHVLSPDPFLSVLSLATRRSSSFDFPLAAPHRPRESFRTTPTLTARMKPHPPTPYKVEVDNDVVDKFVAHFSFTFEVKITAATRPTPRKRRNADVVAKALKAPRRGTQTFPYKIRPQKRICGKGAGLHGAEAESLAGTTWTTRYFGFELEPVDTYFAVLKSGRRRAFRSFVLPACSWMFIAIQVTELRNKGAANRGSGAAVV